MSIVEQIEQELQRAQVELVQADVAAIEVTTRLEAARSAVDKLTAAVLAMKGPTPDVPSEVAAMTGETLAEPTAPLPNNVGVDDSSDSRVADDSATPAPNHDRSATADMTEEEFDAYRQKRQRRRQKELDADNPLAQYKCGGCGMQGTSSYQIITAPSGAPVRLILCSACGNQTF